MGGIDQIPQILARAKAWIDVEEVLNAISMVGLQVRPLAPDGTDPQGGDAELPQVVQLALDPFERPALKLLTGSHPGAFVCSPELLRVGVVEQGPLILAAIAEAVGQEKVQHLITPVGRTEVHVSARLQVRAGEFCGSRWFNDCDRHACSPFMTTVTTVFRRECRAVRPQTRLCPSSGTPAA